MRITGCRVARPLNLGCPTVPVFGRVELLTFVSALVSEPDRCEPVPVLSSRKRRNCSAANPWDA